MDERPTPRLMGGTHTPNYSPCSQTVQLHCDDCTHSALDHSHSVRFVRLHSLHTTLCLCLCPLLMVAALTDPMFTQEGLVLPQASVLSQRFVRSFDLTSHGLHWFTSLSQHALHHACSISLSRCLFSWPDPGFSCSCVLRITPFRRTATLELRKDPSDPQTSSNTGNPREVTFADAATQLSFAEFFERCILSKALPPRPSPSPQPKHMGTSHSICSSSGNSGPIPVPRTQPDSTPPPPPGSHNIPIKAAPVRPHSQLALAFTSSGASVPSGSTPTLQPEVSTTQV